MAAKKVLIVDKSSDARDVLSTTLADAGYDVIEAGSRDDALSMISDQPFDLLMADLDLPNIRGAEFISEIRQVPGSLFTPIVILSEELKAKRRSECISAGVSGYIQKPFHKDQLLSVLRMVVP